MSEGFGDVGKAVDKASIEISEPEEGLNILEGPRELLFLDGLSLDWIYLDPVRCDDESQELHFLLKEFRLQDVHG